MKKQYIAPASTCEFVQTQSLICASPVTQANASHTAEDGFGGGVQKRISTMYI